MGRDLRVAVVDDEESVRNAVVRVLRAAGFTVRGFASGDEFLRSLATELPHCAVLDLIMPDLSGIEVQQTLKTADVNIPVVIMSANEEQRSREECLRAGAVTYLCKPIDIHDLLDAITLALRSFKDGLFGTQTQITQRISVEFD
jgi:FixJ family two-component response regulator